MAKASSIDFDDPTCIPPTCFCDEESPETLAAIDEGVRDAEAGRTAPIKDVRRLLREWITASSSHKER